MQNVGQTSTCLAAQGYDSATGLYYYRARYYDPTTGKFLSEDPLGFPGQNFYAYVRNGPANKIDPWGLTQFNYNVTYSGSVNGESWWQNGKFIAETPPFTETACQCIGGGKTKLTTSVNWDIHIIYASSDQLKHEEIHFLIFKRFWELSRPSYESKYEKVYASREDCEKARRAARQGLDHDLSRDFRALSKIESMHDDLLQRLIEVFQNLW